jgi:hypothetical protein
MVRRPWRCLAALGLGCLLASCGNDSSTGPSTPGSTLLASAGQSAVFLDGPKFSSQLTMQAGAQYLIAVVNTNPQYTVTEDFTLTGSLAAGATGDVAAVPAAPAPATSKLPADGASGSLFAASDAGPAPATLRRFADNHMQLLDLNRQIYSRMRGRRTGVARNQVSAARAARPNFSVTQTVGAVNKVYVRNNLKGSCGTVDSIGARTVAVGQHVIVLADTNLTRWPQAQRPDSSYYQTFANEYDATIWPHIQNNIGNPLLLDGSLSGIGKVTVTITPVLNDLGGGVVAFVNPCDFLPTATQTKDTVFSNLTEMFYSLTPSASGFSVSAWEKELRATAAHETKHIVAISSRFVSNSATLEDIWLEEGLAQASAEIWMRNFNGATWKGRANFAQTVGCEIVIPPHPCPNPATPKPLGLIASHLPFLFDYLRNESQSNSEGLGKDTPANYGAGWAMARWATDQYAGDEATFIKSLISEPQLTGLPNLSAHTGQPIPLLLVYWNLATAIYSTPAYTAADPRTTLPSFELSDIFRLGQMTQFTCGGTPCRLFTDSGTPVYPVQPISLSAGTISKTVTGVPGTAAAFFLLSGTAGGTQSLQLASGTGAAISPTSGFRVGIIRVK